MLSSRAGAKAEADFLRDVADGVYELVSVTSTELNRAADLVDSGPSGRAVEFAVLDAADEGAPLVVLGAGPVGGGICSAQACRIPSDGVGHGEGTASGGSRSGEWQSFFPGSLQPPQGRNSVLLLNG
ncbi:hypothetical protein OHA77_26280 [Streptosporangium sp. NBC_01639]|uniref:hypothetical protein n=1 Tax=Streptosporangium sp. NBC_01639 TaxID=2975948 RepID=UPI0038654041|nr:hypothetical protein OHA77_26280 [Streptosporangium sp. NBC_01639]